MLKVDIVPFHFMEFVNVRLHFHKPLKFQDDYTSKLIEPISRNIFLHALLESGVE